MSFNKISVLLAQNDQAVDLRYCNIKSNVNTICVKKAVVSNCLPQCGNFFLQIKNMRCGTDPSCGYDCTSGMDYALMLPLPKEGSVCWHGFPMECGKEYTHRDNLKLCAFVDYGAGLVAYDYVTEGCIPLELEFIETSQEPEREEVHKPVIRKPKYKAQAPQEIEISRKPATTTNLAFE